MSDDVEITPFFFSLCAGGLALIIGVPIAFWQIRKRRNYGQSIWWEGVGLTLCLTPGFLGWGLITIIENIKDFNVLG